MSRREDRTDGNGYEVEGAVRMMRKAIDLACAIGALAVTGRKGHEQ
jgi:hypothetical protein